MSELKRTQLYEAHLAAGGQMVDFGGWEMPIQYPAGIVTEHLTTRSACGIFDVSHMGRLLIEGPDRLKFMQHVLSSNVAAVKPGRAQYCMIPNAEGGAVDDAYVYMYEEDRYMLVVNASNTDKDLAHFATLLDGFDCTVTNMTDKCASIAIQGPDTDKILSQLIGGEVPVGPKKNDLGFAMMEGRKVWLSRTGYTGEPIGYELFIESAEAMWLWNRLMELGAKPIALGARDTLRLEAGLPLYGHEMGDAPDGSEIKIFSVPLSRFAVSFAEEKGEFVGKAALEDQKANLTTKIVPIALVDRGVIRAGMEIYKGDEKAGWVTSGTMVPYWDYEGEGEATVLKETNGKRSIGFACISGNPQTGDEVFVDVRGKKLKAVVVAKHMIQNDPPFGKAVLIK
jgi:aminomethyltransferase